MMEKASARRVGRWRAPGLVTAALAGLVVLALIVGFAASPYLFAGATLQSEIAAQVRETTGLVVSTRGHARFELLPRPHVAMTNLHFSDPSGTLTIDADALEGNIRVLPLLAGRLELAAATLYRPVLVIDLDGRPMGADSTIGRALHAIDEPGASGRRLGTVTLVDGSATLKSRDFRASPHFDDVDVTVDWRDLESPATLTGSLTVRDTAAEVAAWIAQPANLMRGEASAMALRIRSVPLDLSANGMLVETATTTFQGALSASAPSLPSLLTLGGYKATAVAPFADMAVNSDATIKIDRKGLSAVDLSSLRLDLDGNDYEGTLAFKGGARSSLSGTLATERLSLEPFLHSAPKLVDERRQWSRQAIALDHGDPLDLDLRISATHLRVAPLTIDDAALAVMTRGNRTEVALADGRAYGGTMKARVSIGVVPGGLNLRGTGSLTDADAATLSWDAFGRQLATGKLSGSGNIETSGDSPAALMAHLQGWAKGHASDGEVAGIDLVKGLRLARQTANDAVLPVLRSGRTPFGSLAFGLRLADGVATIDDASMRGPDATLSLTGKADIGKRDLGLQAVATDPSTTPPQTRLRFDVGGSFNKVVVTERPAEAGLAPGGP